MSDVFSVNPVPPEAEGLDIDLDPSATSSDKKFSCDEGEYPAIVTKMELYKKEGRDPRLKIEVTLTAQDVKGIRATRFYDLVGQYSWILTKTMEETFGIETIKSADGKKETLPLKENYYKVVTQPVLAKVKPRTYTNDKGQERTAMDVVALSPMPKAENNSPF